MQLVERVKERKVLFSCRFCCWFFSLFFRRSTSVTGSKEDKIEEGTSQGERSLRSTTITPSNTVMVLSFTKQNIQRLNNLKDHAISIHPADLQ